MMMATYSLWKHGDGEGLSPLKSQLTLSPCDLLVDALTSPLGLVITQFGLSLARSSERPPPSLERLLSLVHFEEQYALVSDALVN